MTCRSGSASFTPSAAPAPQPSPAAEPAVVWPAGLGELPPEPRPAAPPDPAAGLDPKKLPGRVEGQCSGNSVYSLTIVEAGSRASARQALTQTGLSGCRPLTSSRNLRQSACIASRC